MCQQSITVIIDHLQNVCFACLLLSGDVKLHNNISIQQVPAFCLLFHRQGPLQKIP